MALSALVGLGLSLLPKIPDAWGSIAGLFGKVVPTNINEAANLAGEVMSAFKEDKVPPEIVKKVEAELIKHQEKMAELTIADMKSLRELEKAAYLSGDQYIARTRPMILRRLFYMTAAFCILAPASVLIAGGVGVSVTAFMEMIKWIGGFLFSTFGTAYLGYSAMRTKDKNNMMKNGNGGNGLVNLIKAIKK